MITAFIAGLGIGAMAVAAAAWRFVSAPAPEEVREWLDRRSAR